MTKKPLLAIIFALSSILPSYSQAIKPLKPKADWEKWQERVPVGAEFMVGITNNYNTTNITPDRIFVKLPIKHENKLCVAISSIDGRYKAKLEYDISNYSDGIFEFEVPTHFKDQLSKYSTQNVSIISKSCTACTSTGGIHHVSGWFKEFDNVTKYILLGGETPITIVAVDKQGKKSKYSCKRIDDINTISYKWRCEIPQSVLDNSTILIINRVFRSGGEILEKKVDEIEIK